MDTAEYERMYRLENSHWWFVSRRRLATSLIEQWIKPPVRSRILDVGCGTGGNLAALQQWGQAGGIDLNRLPLTLAQGRGLTRLAQASALTLPYANETFDLVTAFDVLYHQWITNDVQAMGELYRVLQPGGWLLVTDSALPALWSTHDEIYQARQRYTLGDIRTKIIEAGFKPRMCSYIYALVLPLTLLVRLIMRWLPLSSDLDMQPPPVWLNKPLIGLSGLEAWWLQQNRTWPVGSSLICLAQKPPKIGSVL